MFFDGNFQLGPNIGLLVFQPLELIDGYAGLRVFCAGVRIPLNWGVFAD